MDERETIGIPEQLSVGHKRISLMEWAAPVCESCMHG